MSTTDTRDTRDQRGSWPPSMPWTVLATEERHCERHGDYLARQFDGIHPDDWRKRAADKAASLRPWLSPWWSRCPSCNHDIGVEQEAARGEILGGDEHRKAMRLQAVERAGIPRRYRDLTPEGYHPQFDRMRAAVAQVRAYCGALPIHRNDGRGLLLFGKPGTGKTHATCVIAAHAAAIGLTARWTTEAAMIQRIRDTWGERGDREASAVAEFADVDLLVIDEVGGRQRPEHGKRLLDQILDARYAGVRPTVLASNLDAPRLRDDLGEHMASRLRQTCDSLVFNWQDLRQEGVRDAR